MWILRAALLGSLIYPIGLSAQEAVPDTFRRVAPPSPDFDGPRINIQIDPNAVEDTQPRPEVVVTGPSEGPTGWFWSVVPAGIDAVNRTNIALNHLAVAPEAGDLPIASLSTLQSIAQSYGADILSATIGTEVSPALALAVIAVESAGRSDAVSHAGAQGLMQLIPATADRFGVEDPFEPRQNIEGGVSYLDWLLETFNQDPILALAGYNAGEGAVLNNNGVPPFAETRDYVPKVLATWDRLRPLCLTVPQDPLDGCVFAVLGATASEG